jgi:hypothetical protein
MSKNLTQMPFSQNDKARSYIGINNKVYVSTHCFNLFHKSSNKASFYKAGDLFTVFLT